MTFEEINRLAYATKAGGVPKEMYRMHDAAAFMSMHCLYKMFDAGKVTQEDAVTNYKTKVIHAWQHGEALYMQYCAGFKEYQCNMKAMGDLRAQALKSDNAHDIALILADAVGRCTGDDGFMHMIEKRIGSENNV